MEKKIIIVVGRQFASGGRALAREVGRRLGIDVYDHELLEKAAEDSGLGKETFKKRDEKRGLFSFSALSNLFASSSTSSSNMDDTFFEIQSNTIRNIAEKGSAIIVGRCADYILRDMDCVVSVFLSAPLETRIQTVCKRMNVDEKTAMAIISKKDRNRPEYYNYYTFGNWGVASNYDLCLNSGKLSTDACADMIMEYAKARGLL